MKRGKFAFLSILTVFSVQLSHPLSLSNRTMVLWLFLFKYHPLPCNIAKNDARGSSACKNFFVDSSSWFLIFNICQKNTQHISCPNHFICSSPLCFLFLPFHLFYFFFPCVTAGSTVVAPCLRCLPTPYYISYNVPPPPSSTLSLPRLPPPTLLLTVSNSVGCQEQQSSKINITLFFFFLSVAPCLYVLFVQIWF